MASTAFQGKLVLITGATGGIGHAMAKEMANRGARLIMTCRPGREAALPTLSGKGHRHICTDLNQPENRLLPFSELIGDDLVPDVLINNAGLDDVEFFHNMSNDQIASMVQVNLTSAIMISRIFLPAMLERGSGLLVNQASINAYIYTPLLSTYVATKAGLAAFTKCLQHELIGSGVDTLLLVTPPVKTKMLERSAAKAARHLQGPSGNALTIEEYAGQVADAIEGRKKVLQPKGAMGIMLRLMSTFPGLQFKKTFSRQALGSS